MAWRSVYQKPNFFFFFFFFFFFYGSDDDNVAFEVNALTVDPCQQYIYLGSPFTVDGSSTSAIKVHVQMKMCQVLKFISFLNKNNDGSFETKGKVFDAALIWNISYGCESWLNGTIKPMNKLDNWCIKQLLDVRNTTTNSLYCLEIGRSVLSALVKAKQRKFFQGCVA